MRVIEHGQKRKLQLSAFMREDFKKSSKSIQSSADTKETYLKEFLCNIIVIKLELRIIKM